MAVAVLQGVGGGSNALLIEKIIQSNGEYTARSDGADGYSKVTVETENLNSMKAFLDNTKSTYNITSRASNVDDTEFKKIFPTADTFENVVTFESAFYSYKITRFGPDMADTKNATSLKGMFAYCTLMQTVELFDTSKVTNMQGMFAGCFRLLGVPLLDTSNVTTMQSMFNMNYSGTGGYSELVSVPLFDTSKVTDMSKMFECCNKLTTVPLFDTSKVTTMAGMFNMYSVSSGHNERDLVSVPLFDTGEVRSMESMFTSCMSLTTVPLFNTSKVTAMAGMFRNCNSLTTVPLFNTSKVTTFWIMFYGCTGLTEIPALDVGAATSTSTSGGLAQMFYGCTGLTAIHIINIKTHLDISWSTQFTRNALLEIIGNLVDVGASRTLTMGSTNLSKLTSADIAIATNKGWTLA